MSPIRILSAGAAQALIHRLMPDLEHAAGGMVETSFGPAGALVARIEGGERADVLILTASAVADFARRDLIQTATVADIGAVHAGIAVRTGDPLPALNDEEDLKAAILAADAIYLPNPDIATSGIHFVKVLERLGVRDEVAARLKPYPNGVSAMAALAASQASRPIGCTQTSEMLHEPGVTLAGLLPVGHELVSVYTAAMFVDASRADTARAIVSLLTGPSTAEARKQSGFVPR